MTLSVTTRPPEKLVIRLRILWIGPHGTPHHPSSIVITMKGAPLLIGFSPDSPRNRRSTGGRRLVLSGISRTRNMRQRPFGTGDAARAVSPRFVMAEGRTADPGEDARIGSWGAGRHCRMPHGTRP